MRLWEIEQKFVFNPALLPRFRMNHGHPAFHFLSARGTSSFQDEYFDSAGKLLSRGLYLRRRNGAWEAKHRLAGDFIRSSFYETTDVEEIVVLIEKHAPMALTGHGPEKDFGLKSICRYRTKREMFLVDKLFEVVLDETDFGHSVGEVEVQAHGNVNTHEDIEEFMRKYEWFFKSDEVPKGKMTAYFEKFGFPL